MEDEHFGNLWALLSSSIKRISKKYDSEWMVRSRLIDSFLLVMIILRISCSRSGYSSSICAMWDEAQKIIPKLRNHKPISASSFCEARMKLHPQIFRDLNFEVIRNYYDKRSFAENWHGHRIFAIDASKINLPIELKSNGYSPSSPTSHYPQGLLSCLFEISTKIPHDFILQSHMSERTCVPHHLNQLNPDDIVIYDRGYFSYDLVLDHIKRGIHCIFRLKSSGNLSGLQSLISKKNLDCEINVRPTRARYCRKVRSRLHVKTLERVHLRLIKYRIKGKLYYLITTLTDGTKYSADDLRDLYGRRWDVEEVFKIIKRTTEVENFHGKNEIAVKQEIFAQMLLITLGRIFSNEVEARLPAVSKTFRKKRYVSEKEANSCEPFRINFKNCIKCVSDALPSLFNRCKQVVKNIILDLVRKVGRYRQRFRPNRNYVRKSMKPVGKWTAQRMCRPAKGVC